MNETKPSPVDTNIEEMSALQIAVYAVNCQNTDEYIDEVAKAIERYAKQKSTTPVQEKPDFKLLTENTYGIPKNDNAQRRVEGFIAGCEYIWKNYVEKQL